MDFFLFLAANASTHWPYWVLGAFCWSALFALLDHRRRLSSKPRIPAFKIKRPIAQAKRTEAFESSASFAALVNACLGDREKALRLVAYEQKRATFLSSYDAVLAALERLASDRYR